MGLGRSFALWLLLPLLSVGLCWPGGAGWAQEPQPRADLLGLKVPRASKVLGEQLWSSGLGFRKTVRFYKRLFKRKGIEHEAIAVYRYRGVAVARFLSKGRGARWSAVQIFLKRGLTRVAIVPAPVATNRP